MIGWKRYGALAIIGAVSLVAGIVAVESTDNMGWMVVAMAAFLMAVVVLALAYDRFN